MPELPEVETTRRGLIPWMRGATIADLIVRESRLRWPIASDLAARLRGQVVTDLTRRGKYLIVSLEQGALIIHLGMSGSLRIVGPGIRPGSSEPFDLVLAGESAMAVRMRDPRRFGALLFSEDPLRHPLIAPLGPEPLEPGFGGAYLRARSHGRRIAIRDLLLNGHIVAGIGNIYANEALFEAGIHPGRAAGRIGADRYEALAQAVIAVLSRAVEAGGTTLKDFAGSDGRPGYFQQQLRVYGREGRPCPRCTTPVARLLAGGRSSYYCPKCQR